MKKPEPCRPLTAKELALGLTLVEMSDAELLAYACLGMRPFDIQINSARVLGEEFARRGIRMPTLDEARAFRAQPTPRVFYVEGQPVAIFGPESDEVLAATMIRTLRLQEMPSLDDSPTKLQSLYKTNARIQQIEALCLALKRTWLGAPKMTFGELLDVIALAMPDWPEIEYGFEALQAGSDADLARALDDVRAAREVAGR